MKLELLRTYIDKWEYNKYTPYYFLVLETNYCCFRLLAPLRPNIFVGVTISTSLCGLIRS